MRECLSLVTLGGDQESHYLGRPGYRLEGDDSSLDRYSGVLAGMSSDGTLSDRTSNVSFCLPP